MCALCSVVCLCVRMCRRLYAYSNQLLSLSLRQRVRLCVCVQGELLRLRWRKQLVLALHDSYFNHTVAFRVNTGTPPKVDNMDQRLTEE